MAKKVSKPAKRDGHDRWGMQGKKAGPHTPKSKKRTQNKLRKELREW